eukprot:gene6346-6413_t
MRRIDNLKRRYSNLSVEQLVSDKLEVRLGAIFVLRQIANDFEDLAVPTVQLLTAYLRIHNKTFLFNVAGANLRRTNLSDTILEKANLARADFTGATFRGADFKDANLDGTILIGADLTGAKNLTVAQLRKAFVDETTRLPSYLAFDQIKSAA